VAGIKDPVIDALIDKVIFARNREELVTATQALDRVLLWGHYVVPHWYSGGTYYAYWDRFGRPDIVPPYGDGVPTTWWYTGEPKEMVKEAENQQESE
jgi:microcin C transport system substrate-binding protein